MSLLWRQIFPFSISFFLCVLLLTNHPPIHLRGGGDFIPWVIRNIRDGFVTLALTSSLNFVLFYAVVRKAIHPEDSDWKPWKRVFERGTLEAKTAVLFQFPAFFFVLGWYSYHMMPIITNTVVVHMLMPVGIILTPITLFLSRLFFRRSLPLPRFWWVAEIFGLVVLVMSVDLYVGVLDKRGSIFAVTCGICTWVFLAMGCSLFAFSCDNFVRSNRQKSWVHAVVYLFMFQMVIALLLSFFLGTHSPLTLISEEHGILDMRFLMSIVNACGMETMSLICILIASPILKDLGLMLGWVLFVILGNVTEYEDVVWNEHKGLMAWLVLAGGGIWVTWLIVRSFLHRKWTEME